MSETIKVLLVDDNAAYRQAFCRNLAFQGFETLEAANAEEAARQIAEGQPEVMITDLQMRTRTEGLDLIAEARRMAPLMPVIMISAVGTFEEGAAASRLGAMHVVSKSKIEDEIGHLHGLIRSAAAERRKSQTLVEEIEAIRQAPDGAAQETLSKLRAILVQSDVNGWVKGEAYEALVELAADEMRARSRDSARPATGPETAPPPQPEGVDLARMSPDSLESLRTAEFLYHQDLRNEGGLDFSRNIGFSYCFAVETEAKAALSKKLHRMLLAPQTIEIVNQFLDGPARRLNIFFHQMLLQVQRQHPMDFSMDNVRQVFLRILEYHERYKPDGLKALAVVLLVFARTYEVRTARSSVQVRNPMNIKGLEEEAVIALAQRLARLQHYRNPYIHPEINELETVSAIREEALACLRAIQGIV